jgi:hypothetical protein
MSIPVINTSINIASNTVGKSIPKRNEPYNMDAYMEKIIINAPNLDIKSLVQYKPPHGYFLNLDSA